MSAFIVSKGVIDAIVKAGLELGGRGGPLTWYAFDAIGNETARGRLEYTNADEVGQMLWDENHRSVDFRYNEVNERPVYTYSRMLGYAEVKHIPRILGLLGCYEYQACEADDWRFTEAHAFCETFKAQLIGRLPGYDWPSEDELPTLYGDRKVVSITEMIATTRRVNL